MNQTQDINLGKIIGDLVSTLKEFQTTLDIVNRNAVSYPMYPMNLENCTNASQVALSQEEEGMAQRIRRQITLPNGETRWITGRNEQEYANNLLKALNLTFVDGKGQSIKHDFEEYAWNWLNVYARANIQEVTARSYEQQLRCHIIPALKGMAIEDITTDDVMKLFNCMDADRKKSHWTKGKVKTVLNMIFEYAVEDGFIQRSPLASKKVKIKGLPSKATELYSVEQMEYIVQHIGDVRTPYDRNYIAIQSTHPMRLEEMLGLRWRDVDIQAEEIHIRNTVTHPDRNQGVFAEMTKTDASRRDISLVNEIVPFLTIGNPNEFVVGGEKCISYQQLKLMRKRIDRDMGFSKRFGEVITPRRFRTTVLSDIYFQTKDIKQTQAAAGHTSEAMTLRYYVKGRGAKKDTSKAIAAAYSLQS